MSTCLMILFRLTEKNMDNKFLIIRSRPHGFFSIFFHTIDNIKWAEDNGFIPVVSWGPGRSVLEFKEQKNYFLQQSDTAFLKECLYKDRDTENPWLSFFKPVSNYDLGDIPPKSTVLESDIFQAEDFLIDNLRNYYPLKIWNVLGTNLFIKNRVFIKEDIREQIDFFIKKYFVDNMLGIHVRGTDKAKEQIEGGLFSGRLMIDDYILEAKKYINKFPEAKIFIASDNNETIATFMSVFTPKKIVVSKSLRMKSYKSSVPVHLSGNCNVATGIEVLKDMYLLNKTRKLICTDSNVAAAALFFNKDLEYKFMGAK